MRLVERLHASLSASSGAPVPFVNDMRRAALGPGTPAAVLIAITDRPEPGLILTQRPDTMRHHAGQVAFPGGRVDPGDADAVAAALREADEEVGVDPSTVKLLGQGDTYLTGSGFAIAPFVGLLPASYVPRPDPREVADVFETPLSFLMDAANHQRHEKEYAGVLRAYYAMPHNGRYIWGATAGMLKSLHDRLYGA